MADISGLYSDAGLTEQFRISVDAVFRQLGDSCAVQEYIFPEHITNTQRKYIHGKCKSLGFNSKSHGKEPHRTLRVWKKNTTHSKVFLLKQDEDISATMKKSLTTYRGNLGHNLGRNHNHTSSTSHTDKAFGRLIAGSLTEIPKSRPPIALKNFRQQLPVWSKKNEILNLLECNQVLIISSETGSGKTTQIPQFILDDVCEKGGKCKVICTQPRRISTITVAERVSAERGERIGDTVGYQIKLETRIGVNSGLIYCTNGILLRTLMNATNGSLRNITHIIVDEIHERDKYTDFMLIFLKRLLVYSKHLKVILMSATANVDLFMSYFENATLLNVPGKLFTIQELYLEDILIQLKHYGVYKSNLMEHFDEEDVTVVPENNVVDDEYTYSVIESMDHALNDCISNGDEGSFSQMMMSILSESADLNYRSRDQGFTPLIAAAIQGNFEIARQLLCMGADTSIRSKICGLTAQEWARNKSHFDVAYLIQHYISPTEGEDSSEGLLEIYDRAISSDEFIDFCLITKIITHIHQFDNEGTILIFLPGYDDINKCLQNILSDSYINESEFEIFMLHSSMKIKAQHRVFEPIPNKQKIILSTNIAETSITIADVVYVIDTGRAKEKTYDTISGTQSLQATWISKASVKQRAGRAGRTRPGVCFHLFSRKRFESLLNNCIPEILRVPLHELCLQTKLLAPADLKIADYLQLALEPPPSWSVDFAIYSLKALGALDENEDLTDLGAHLVQLSIEPRLGKMLIYAVILKCLDPVLTIVACLSCKEPFILPQQPKFRYLASKRQAELAGNSFSDHLAFLRAYQIWQQSTVTKEDDMLTELFIDSVAMQIIHDTRSQLLSQLRGAGFVLMNKSFSIQDANTNSGKWPLVKAALTVGCYPNVSYETKASKFSTRKETHVGFYKSSCFNGISDRDLHLQDITKICIMYEELSKIGKQCSIKCGTAVTPLTVALMCGDDKNKTFEKNTIILDEYMSFNHYYDEMAMFCREMKTVINRRIANPRQVLTLPEQGLLNALTEILAYEEKHFPALQQPAGIGLVPKLFSNPEFNSPPRRKVFNRRYGNSMNSPEARRYPQNNRNHMASKSTASLSDMGLSGVNLPSTSTGRNHTRRTDNSGGNFKQNKGSSCSYAMDNLNFPNHDTKNETAALNFSDVLLNGLVVNSLTDRFLNGASDHSLENNVARHQSSLNSIVNTAGNDSNTLLNGLNVDALPFTSTSNGYHADNLGNNHNMHYATNRDTYRPGHRYFNRQNNITANQNTNHAHSAQAALCNGFSNRQNVELLPQNTFDGTDEILQALNNLKTGETSENKSDILPLDKLTIPDYTAFFIIRPPDYNNFRLGISSGTWIFSPQTEKKIFTFLRKGYFVVLCFSIAKTQEFQGVARLLNTNSMVDLKCPIQWLSTTPVPHRRIRTRNLTNPYDGDRLLFQCEDGQQVELSVGRQLCNMFFESVPPEEQNFSRPILGSTSK